MSVWLVPAFLLWALGIALFWAVLYGYGEQQGTLDGY